MARIYLSSTYSDLAEHREATYRTLRQLQHDVVAMEDYVATDQRPLDKCLTDVAGCDMYIGLFAWRYGFRPPGYNKAITELEYRKALGDAKPCLIFLTADDAPWSPALMDEDLQAIRKLRAYLRLNHTVSFFHTADDLAGTVGVAVTNILNSRLSEADEPAQAGIDPQLVAFLQANLKHITADLESDIQLYWRTGRAIFAVGIILLILSALLGNVVLGIGAILISVLALLPLVARSSMRRNQTALDQHRQALHHASPDAVRTVQRFLTHQLAI